MEARESGHQCSDERQSAEPHAVHAQEAAHQVRLALLPRKLPELTHDVLQAVCVEVGEDELADVLRGRGVGGDGGGGGSERHMNSREKEEVGW